VSATTNPTTATSEGTNAPDVEEHAVDPLDVSFVSTFRHQHLNMIGQLVPAPLAAPNKIDGKGKQRSELSYRRRHATSPEAVEVPVARGFRVTFNSSCSHLHSY